MAEDPREPDPVEMLRQVAADVRSEAARLPRWRYRKRRRLLRSASSADSAADAVDAPGLPAWMSETARRFAADIASDTGVKAPQTGLAPALSDS